MISKCELQSLCLLSAECSQLHGVCAPELARDACLVPRGRFRSHGCFGFSRDRILFPHRVLYSASISGALTHVRSNFRKYRGECRMASMLMCFVVSLSILSSTGRVILPCVLEYPKALGKLSSLSTYPFRIPTELYKSIHLSIYPFSTDSFTYPDICYLFTHLPSIFTY